MDNLQLLLTTFLLITMSSRNMFVTAKSARKHLWIVRHGQAMHNPRAEAAKEAGCSHDEFLDFMRQDDALDADLTEIGENQARTVGSKCAWDLLQLVVSSPLSRALHTENNPKISPPSTNNSLLQPPLPGARKHSRPRAPPTSTPTSLMKHFDNTTTSHSSTTSYYQQQQ